MSKIFAIVLSGVLLTSTVSFADTLSVGVVNMEKIFSEAKARKSLMAKVDALRERLQKDVSSQEDALRTADENLSKQQADLSKSEFNKQKAALEAKIMKFRQDVNEYQDNIRTTYETGVQEIQGKLEEIVTVMAPKKNIDIILPSNVVLYTNNKAQDITGEILSTLDKELPAVKITECDINKNRKSSTNKSNKS